jgi:TRAP-type C4-dicarboxylate transport system substrate-binding protein
MLNGRADLAMAPSRAWAGFGILSLRALEAPLLIDSYALQERVLRSSLVAPMLDELGKLNFAGIGILPGGMHHPVGFGHRFAGPEDFKGLTVGTGSSRVAEAVLRALGARPARLPARMRNANGLDGVVHRLYAINNKALDLDGSQLTTNVILWPRPLVLFARAGSSVRLKAKELEILRTAAANIVSTITTRARADELEASGNICRRGGTTFVAATAAELGALRLAVDPVLRDLERDPGTRAAIEKIQSLKAQLAQSPDGLPACAPTRERPASSKTAMDGVWRMKTGPEAAGTEGAAENWGDWIYVFDRGKFAITQENSEACTWGYGTFSVAGSQMTWTFTDGGGFAPNGAQNKPGEHFVFGLSAYRDTLTVTPVAGAISPSNFREKPWRRLSSTPSRKFFSKRCPPPAAALPA